MTSSDSARGSGGGPLAGERRGGFYHRLRQVAAQTGLTVRQTLRSFRLRPADRLLIAPQELETGDPSAAIAIYSGQVVLAGRTVHTRGESMFRIMPPDIAWAQAVHGFSWLRHFRDADNPVIRHHARALAAEWLQMREMRTHPIAQQPGVVADRMLSWLIHAPLLIGDADHAYYSRFMRSLARDAGSLGAAARRRSLGMDRLYAAIALALYTLCANLPDDDWQKGRDLLMAALADTILADGTPLSRNPADALRLLAQLLQLRTAYTARARTSGQTLQTAIDRLFSFLRLLRHPDGAIALFNGMGASELGLVGSILAFDDGLAEAPAAARFGGYHRLECADAVVIADAGGGPPAAAARDAHACALSFEFSARRERIVVNCGAAPAGLGELREALRETAAHSTLSFKDTSSARFRSDATGRSRIMIDAADRPKVERMTSQEGSAGLWMSYEGYKRSHGLTHARRLMLSSDGAELAGVDSMLVASEKASGAVLRFHLHPRVQATLSADRTMVTLNLSDASVWQFDAGGLAIAIEDSIFMGGLSSQRRTSQLVVATPDTEAEVRWRFRRLDG